VRLVGGMFTSCVLNGFSVGAKGYKSQAGF